MRRLKTIDGDLPIKVLRTVDRHGNNTQEEHEIVDVVILVETTGEQCIIDADLFINQTIADLEEKLTVHDGPSRSN